MSAFQDVATVNTAFGNPKGTPVISERFVNLVRNIAGDGSNGLQGEVKELYKAIAENNVEEARDALCDIIVFAHGGQFYLGVDGDADLKAVTDSLFSRLCKNTEELAHTLNKYQALGVETYSEGVFPMVAVKVKETVIGKDGEEYVKGKFLKSVNYKKPVFPAV